MVVRAKTYTTIGLEGHEVVVEADSSRALPIIDIVGLPDAAVKEAKERLRSACRNSNIELPPHKMILNLAPSDVKKTGTSFDLAMAMGLLQLVGGEKKGIEDYLFFGELGLDGSVRRINGLLPAILSAVKNGYEKFVVPKDNITELVYIPDIQLFALGSIQEVIPFVMDNQELIRHKSTKTLQQWCSINANISHDFGHIKGHAKIKRALTIAAAGRHNILLVGAPGSGKTMLSKALQSILPPLGFDEILEVSQVYSVVGALSNDLPLITARPFRQVHHTASKVSIVGGGQRISPGEVSLAHHGILFFDELAEFPRDVLEVLRQPLEDKIICISRANGTIKYPADFMFVASMNPCKCGFYKDPVKACKCSLNEIKRYQSKISGPLLDRIDMILEVPREKIETILEKASGDDSLSIKTKVIDARNRQQQRFAGTTMTANAQMSAHDIQNYIPLDKPGQDFIKQAASRLHLSARVVHRTIKLARTIADVSGVDNVSIQHLAEAMQYRSKSMFEDG